MEKLPLEELFESGFTALGIGFSRRIYGEEVFAAASVDDVLGEETIEERVQKMHDAHRINPDAAVIESRHSKLTAAQREVLYSHPPFFRRSADPYDGWVVEYTADIDADLPCYRMHAGDLVRKGSVTYESVRLRYGKIAHVEIIRNEQTARPHNIDVYLTRIESILDDPLTDVDVIVARHFQERQKKILAIRALDEQVFSPEQVYYAAMGFLTG